MILTDTHMHSSFSADSDALMEEMIISAIEKNLKHICFTEHLDLDFPKKYKLDFTFNIDNYFHTVNKLKNKYSDKIDISYGIEIGMVPYLADRYDEIINKYKFDFVICSSHLVNMSDPYYSEFWEDKSFDEGCIMYFQTIIDNINSFKNFDSYGHLDYIIRYGIEKKELEYDNYRQIIDDILMLLINNNKALEINAAGYKYGLMAPNPSTKIIERYFKLGGKLITIGSDAHKPEHVAYDYSTLESELKRIGVKQYVYYKNRKPVLVDL